MWMRIAFDPAVLIAGNTVRVTVMTFYITGNQCWDAPHITPIPNATWYGSSGPVDLGLELVVARDQERVVAPLVQRPSDGAFWDGSVVFPSPGVWTVYAKRSSDPPVPNSEVDAHCSGQLRAVTVYPVGTHVDQRPRSGNTTTRDWLSIIYAVALILCACVALSAIVLATRAYLARMRE